MTPEDVIRGFCEGVEHTSEEKEYANTLFQEAIKIGMEINQRTNLRRKIFYLRTYIIGIIILPKCILIQLKHLFMQCHPIQQIFHSGFNRLSRIFINRFL